MLELTTSARSAASRRAAACCPYGCSGSPGVSPTTLDDQDLEPLPRAGVSPPASYDRPVPTPTSPPGLAPDVTAVGACSCSWAAVPVLLLTLPLLRRLPEPDEPDGKPRYRDLPTGRFLLGCTVLAGAGAGAGALTACRRRRGRCGGSSALRRWCWPRSTPGRRGCPLRLTHLVWACTAVAAVVGAVLGGPGLLARTAVGAAGAALLYLVLWRLSGRTLGFGDVRLAPVLGAAGAAVGWSTLLATLLLGSLAGAAVGLVLALRRRRGAFAYAPSMLAGAFLACLARVLSG